MKSNFRENAVLVVEGTRRKGGIHVPWRQRTVFTPMFVYDSSITYSFITSHLRKCLRV